MDLHSLGQILKRRLLSILLLNKIFKKSLRKLNSKFWSGPHLCVESLLTSIPTSLFKSLKTKLLNHWLRNISIQIIRFLMRQEKTDWWKMKNQKSKKEIPHGISLRNKRLLIFLILRNLSLTSWLRKYIFTFLHRSKEKQKKMNFSLCQKILPIRSIHNVEN